MESKFEDAVVQHVLERLLVEIDKGETIKIQYMTYNPDGTTGNLQTRDVNLKHTMVSSVIEQVINDNFLREFKEKIEKEIISDSFTQNVAKKSLESLINWLERSDSSYYVQREYANKTAFKESVRKEVIKLVAKAQADKILAESEQ